MSATITAAEPQHLHALARANEIRLARATMKREIASGDRSVAEVLMDCPREIARMEIGELLSCQRRWGGQRTRRLLATVPVVETKLVGTLTERQRRAIADALDSTLQVV
ncbi:MAG: hypothetical protein J7513_01940 [Solirubrobacteraceae bacterium]|nr:hypothetical protein [Solirubrobacteraceae bacterium]